MSLSIPASLNARQLGKPASASAADPQRLKFNSFPRFGSRVKLEQLFLERLFPKLALWSNGNERFGPVFCGSGSAASEANQNVSGEVGRKS